MSPWSLPILAVAALVACFLVRRALFIIAALVPARPFQVLDGSLPSVTLLVPASDEERTIDGTLDALDRLDYPPEALFVTLVSDGSSDGTGGRLQAWAATRPRVLAIDLPHRVGKFEALNRAVRAAPEAGCGRDLRRRPSAAAEVAPRTRRAVRGPGSRRHRGIPVARKPRARVRLRVRGPRVLDPSADHIGDEGTPGEADRSPGRAAAWPPTPGAARRSRR